MTHRTFYKFQTYWKKSPKGKKTKPENKVEKAFSLYIRTRDAINDFKREDIGRCCTCRKIIPVKGNDAGHFITRGQKAIKYDERNVHLQCRTCNRFQSGAWDKYYEFMLEKYGQGVIDELMRKKYEVCKEGIRDYTAEAKYWRDKTKDLLLQLKLF